MERVKVIGETGRGRRRIEERRQLPAAAQVIKDFQTSRVPPKIQEGAPFVIRDTLPLFLSCVCLRPATEGVRSAQKFE